MLKEFREFALRGNALDLAIGLIIGAAFGAIVSSLVDDVIMPPIGLLLGNVDFANLFLTLKDGPQAPGPYASLEAARTAGAVTWNIGLFINAVIKFVIVAFAVFLVVKMFNRMREQFDRSKEILLRKEKEELASTAEPAPLPAAVAAAPAASPRQEILLEEIRDLLRTQQTKPAARSRSTPSGSQTK